MKYDIQWIKEKQRLREALINKRKAEHLTLEAFSKRYNLNCKDLINFIYQDSISGYNYYKFREVTRDD